VRGTGETPATHRRRRQVGLLGARKHITPKVKVENDTSREDQSKWPQQLLLCNVRVLGLFLDCVHLKKVCSAACLLRSEVVLLLSSVLRGIDFRTRRVENGAVRRLSRCLWRLCERTFVFGLLLERPEPAAGILDRAQISVALPLVMGL